MMDGNFTFAPVIDDQYWAVPLEEILIDQR